MTEQTPPGFIRVQGFQPVPPTVHPPSAYRRAQDEFNDRDWLSGMLEDADRRRDADDLRAARGVLMPIAIFLSLGLGVIVGLFIGSHLR